MSAYLKTYTIDETFVMQDTNDGMDIASFRLSPETVSDMFMWNGYFEPATGHTAGLYVWTVPMPLDLQGAYIDNFYNNTGVISAFTTFSTMNNPTTVRMRGTVKVMFMPVASRLVLPLIPPPPSIPPLIFP